MDDIDTIDLTFYLTERSPHQCFTHVAELKSDGYSDKAGAQGRGAARKIQR